MVTVGTLTVKLPSFKPLFHFSTFPLFDNNPPIYFYPIPFQGGSVVKWVRALDLKSGGPGSKPRSDCKLELFLSRPEFNSSAMLVM